jgi:hypothetical protein
MRATVAQAAGGEDAFKLHEEKPLDLEAQQALSFASQIVSQESAQTFANIMPAIQQLVQKVQQMQQAQQQNALNADPTAQVLLKTQMAETQRKTQEFQTKMQQELGKAQQDYQLKVAELQQKVQELQAKYTTQTNIDNQRNATDIAMANINNAAKERVAQINSGAQMDQFQAEVEHDQNMSALAAIDAANQDIRQHGLAIEQQAFDQQAQRVAQAAQAQQQAGQAQQQHEQQMMQSDQGHQQDMMQADQQHQQALEQQAAAPQPQQGTPNE